MVTRNGMKKIERFAPIWEEYISNLYAVDVAQGYYFTILSLKDGTIEVSGAATGGKGHHQYKTNEWENIIAISTTDNNKMSLFLLSCMKTERQLSQAARRGIETGISQESIFLGCCCRGCSETRHICAS